MVAEHVAVIGEEDDERLLQDVAPRQRLDNAADLFIDETDGAVVALSRAAHLIGAEIAMPGIAFRSAARRVSLRPATNLGGRQFRVSISAPEALRRIVRTMRSGEGHLEEEGLGPLIALDPRGGRLA